MKMSALYRQWLIMNTFPPRGKISTTALRDRLADYGIETTLRTIQRDLVYLGSVFKLECDENNPAGWSWPKDKPAFGIANIDPVTALTFKLAEKHLEHMFPRGALSVLEPYFKAANERIRQTAESTLSHWPDKVRVVSRNLPMIYPQITEDIRDNVYTAVLEERRFGATYRTLGGKVKEYDVNPLGMAFVEGLTYLIATLNKYEDPVLLLLHRLLEVRPTDVPITIPEGFDLDEYIDEELKFPIGDDIKLKALFSDKSDIERLRETPISEDQKITEKDGGWLVQATVGNSYQLRWWLRGYGERIKVTGPKNLQLEFAEMTRKMSLLYSVVNSGDLPKPGQDVGNQIPGPIAMQMSRHPR
jgi:predicted DNA-binding transcriptional regulator YafY